MIIKSCLEIYYLRAYVQWVLISETVIYDYSLPTRDNFINPKASLMSMVHSKPLITRIDTIPGVRIQYDIQSLDDPAVKGNVVIDRNILAAYQMVELYDKAKKGGLTRKDLVYYMTRFDPAGTEKSGDVVDSIRVGLENDVLERICADAIEDNAKLIAFRTDDPKLMSFANRNRFKHYRGHQGDHYFKLVK